MFKAIVFALIGAGVMYVYLEGGDINSFVNLIKGVVNQGAGLVEEATQ
jgi:hypothetical protein